MQVAQMPGNKQFSAFFLGGGCPNRCIRALICECLYFILPTWGCLFQEKNLVTAQVKYIYIELPYVHS